MYKETLKEIKISDVKIIDRRRKKKETINSLIESIKYDGLINPITVQENGQGEYILIAGYHRLQACKALMKETILCMARKYDKDILLADIDLMNNSVKLEENHIRQTFTPAEIAEDLIELENSYKQRFPEYETNPLKFIERHKQKLEEKKRLSNLSLTAKTKDDKELYDDRLRDMQKELERITPPSENIKNLFPSAGKKDIESAKKIVEAEKKNHGLIRNLTNDNVNKTTINQVVDELVKDENAIEYNSLNEEHREEFIKQLARRNNVKKLGIPIAEVSPGRYELGKMKKHCAVLMEKMHLVAKDRYNVTIEVRKDVLFNSAIKTLDLEYFNCLIIFYSKEELYKFVECFK